VPGGEKRKVKPSSSVQAEQFSKHMKVSKEVSRSLAQNIRLKRLQSAVKAADDLLHDPATTDEDKIDISRRKRKALLRLTAINSEESSAPSDDSH
jgi:hypothetical protein